MILMGKDDTEVQTTLSNFSFSGVGIDKLDGSEFTLVTILVDFSWSVGDFKNELEKGLNTIIQSCKKAPTSENILIRIAGFTNKVDGNIKEIHGFTPLMEISDDRYVGAVVPDGMTPLYDAAGNALESIETYGKSLVDQDYECNGIFFVLTDGVENASRTIRSASEIKDGLKRVRVNEYLLGMRSVLIGVNDVDCKAKLEQFKDDAGFDEFVSLGDATPSKLAKLANWVSQSISSQSQSLANGGAPSQPIEFTL